MNTEARLDQVERRLEWMGSRLRHLEVETETGETAPPSQAPPIAPAPEPEPWPPESRPEPAPDFSPPQPPRTTVVTGTDFEEVFGGRVLAWVGSLAILLGIALFMGMAISRGWLGEEARTAIAMVGSFALLVAGVWLHERKGRTEAARAAVAAAISGLFATLLVATQVYDLIPSGSGLVFAALIAAVGLAIAVRWSSVVVAAIGSLGALAAPVLVGSGTSGAGIAFLALALAAVSGILIWQRWDWLALGAFLVSAPQLLVWAAPEGRVDETVLVPLVLLGFWALYVAAAFGYELRTRADDELPIASWLLLFAATALVVSVGHAFFERGDDHSAAIIWVFGFSGANFLLGGLAMRLRVHREIGALLLANGIALIALGLAEVLDGPGLVAAWAAASAVLAYLSTRVESEPNPALSSAERLLIGAGAFLALGLAHTLAVEAPPVAMVEGVDDLAAAVLAIAACAAAAFACQHFAQRIEPVSATVAAFVGAGALVYLGSVLIVDAVGVDAHGEARQAGQVWLSAFWAATGLGAVVWGLMRKSSAVRLGGLALLGLAIAKVWTYDLSELDELARVLSFVGLGLLLLVGAFAYQRLGADERPARVSR